MKYFLSIYGNLNNSAIFGYKKALERLNGPVDRREWSMSPQTVNAYFSPTKNEIVFPAAYLQPPNFNPKADDAVNYGAIGVTIGHEISHAFDDKGSQFDGDGNLRNWWTKEDRDNFDKRTAQLANQYSQYEVLPGRTLTTSTDSNIYGPDREIVEGVTFADEISIDFQASSGLNERVFFENWQRQAFNEQTFNIGYYRNYIGSMEVYLLDQQDRRRYGLRMEEVFPKTITASNLNYQAATEILKTNVQFTFRKWTNLDANQTGTDVTGRIFNTVIRGVERNISRNVPRLLNLL